MFVCNNKIKSIKKVLWFTLWYRTCTSQSEDRYLKLGMDCLPNRVHVPETDDNLCDEKDDDDEDDDDDKDDNDDDQNDNDDDYIYNDTDWQLHN